MTAGHGAVAEGRGRRRQAGRRSAPRSPRPRPSAAPSWCSPESSPWGSAPGEHPGVGAKSGRHVRQCKPPVAWHPVICHLPPRPCAEIA